MTSLKVVALAAALLTFFSLAVEIQAAFSTYQSAPSLLYTFDAAPTMSLMAAGNTNFTWEASSNGRSGVAFFDGIGAAANPNFIDMHLYPDNFGNYMPYTIGGEMSFEMWIDFASLQSNGHMLDIGQGTSGNIFMSNGYYSWNSNTPNQVQFFSGAFAVESNWVVTPNMWLHFVATVVQNNASDNSSAQSATVTFYSNTVTPVANSGYSNPTLFTLPPAILRSNAWLARSAWTPPVGGDNYFNGWIDTFAYYNYGLSSEAVKVHFVIPRPPTYEVTFSRNPALSLSSGTPTYGWTATDTSDASSVALYHNGILTLSGTSQYANLSSLSTPSSIATTIPIIGGSGSGTGASGNGLSSGWSFEVIVKFAATTANTAVFDLSGLSTTDSISLGLSSSDALQFSSANSATSGSATVNVLSTVTSNVWYHIAIVMNRDIGSIIPYVNGVAGTAFATTTAFPAAVSRVNSLLGTAAVGTRASAFANIKVDALRVYDYVLTPAVVTSLYQLTVQNITAAVPAAPPLQSGPLYIQTFDQPAALTTEQQDNSVFTFASGAGAHVGLAQFDGVYGSQSYANLAEFPDGLGNLFQR